MGSQVSNLKGSPSTSGPPKLPFDIFLEVLSHLQTSVAEDREILVALALCCRALRDASQRILFSRMHYGYLDTTSDRKIHNLKVHSEFLRAIVGSPHRLALYVLSYSQHALALDPKLRSTAKGLSLGHKKTHIRIWKLTEQAFSLMTNLKHLKFTPLIHRSSSPVLLRRSTFQLESLIWAGLGSENDLYASFLPTQRTLLHLNINAESYSNGPALPDGLCPSVTSIACSLSELSRVSASRRIIALQVALSSEDLMASTSRQDACVAALKKIQFLRVWTLPQFHQLSSGIVLHNITLLQVRSWKIEDMTLLAQFPNLRSVRLWNPYPSDLDNSIHRSTALCAFTECPKLERVLVFASVAPPILVWRFLLRLGGGIHEELVSMNDFIDSMWWNVDI